MNLFLIESRVYAGDQKIVWVSTIRIQLSAYGPSLSLFSLIKEETQRPKYNRLLEHDFIKRSETERVDVAAYVCSVLDDMANNGITAFTTDQP